MISRFKINGFRQLFLLNPLYRYSTTATLAEPAQSHFLVDYLINSIGLSKDEALSATKNVKLYRSTRNDPDLVVNFFNELGMNRTQIRSLISANPTLLTFSVHKTLQPKVLALHEIGILGSDLIKVLLGFKSLFGRGIIRRPIEYLRNLLGSNENVAVVIRKFSSVLDISASRVIETNVQVLLSEGFSMEYVSRMLLDNPRCFMQKPGGLAEALHIVENEFRISRDSKMFYHGVITAASLGKEIIDMKIGVLRSFGFSDVAIYGMIRRFPVLIRSSEEKLRKIWNFFTNETAFSPDYLASHPVIFSLSLEKRVMPRFVVLKILNEMNLNKRTVSLYGALCMSESNFVQKILLPYKDDIPAVISSYFKIVGRKKKQNL